MRRSRLLPGKRRRRGAVLSVVVWGLFLWMAYPLFAAPALALLTAGGALALVLLLAADLFLAARGMWRWFFQPTPRVAA